MQGTDYSVSDRQLTLNKAIPANSLLKIYRETTTDTIVSWNDASVLRAKDMSLQEVQLLHLAEETADKVFDTGMSTAPTNTNVWDGQYKRITNLLDPQEDGDAVTLRYIQDKQSSLINALKNEGANQNSSIVATGTAQSNKVVSTGDTQAKRVRDTGDTQATRLNGTGDTQNSRLTTTGDSYVKTMTSLKADATTQANTATNKATEASNSAELAKKWAMSDSSPDGVSGNKSSKTWANEAKNSASSASSSASTATTKANEAKTSATNAASSASTATMKATEASNSATSAASSASTATTKATEAKTSATSASNSAIAAAKSAQLAGTFDPTNYPLKKYILDLSALDENTFYPVVFDECDNSIEVEIHSRDRSEDFAYNQNVLSFRIFAKGWGDGASKESIKDYFVFDSNEITIGSVAVGLKHGGACVWLRGGKPSPYTIISTVPPQLFANGWSEASGQIATVGSTYHGAETGNANLNIIFNPLDIPNNSAKNLNYTTYGTFEKAIKDADGRVIKDTYATLEKVYPVGSIYMNATDSRNPAQIFGFGTWTQISAGRVLLGAGTADSGTVYNAGGTGGEEKHQLTVNELPAHNHSGSTQSAGAHTHTIQVNANGYPDGQHDTSNKNDYYWRGTAYGSDQFKSTQSAGSHTHSVSIGDTGGNGYHNNMQPYLVVYIFKRTA